MLLKAKQSCWISQRPHHFTANIYLFALLHNTGSSRICGLSHQPAGSGQRSSRTFWRRAGVGNQPGNGGPGAKPSRAKWRANTEAACCSRRAFVQQGHFGGHHPLDLVHVRQAKGSPLDPSRSMSSWFNGGILDWRAFAFWKKDLLDSARAHMQRQSGSAEHTLYREDCTNNRRNEET